MSSGEALDAGALDRQPSDILSPRHSFSPCDIVGYVDDDSAPEVILAFMIYVTTFAREES